MPYGFEFPMDGRHRTSRNDRSVTAINQIRVHRELLSCLSMDSSRTNDYALRITADEVNCLIYSYLLDSGILSLLRFHLQSDYSLPGFTHSAFAVKIEGQLDRSPYASKHIQRGELIELLSKSLLYIEVESHWKNDALASTCKSGFSLLEPHVCSSSEPASKQPLQVISAPETSGDVPSRFTRPNGSMADAASKRKESPTFAYAEGPAEKRAKRDPDEMDLDTPYECKLQVLSDMLL